LKMGKAPRVFHPVPSGFQASVKPGGFRGLSAQTTSPVLPPSIMFLIA